MRLLICVLLLAAFLIAPLTFLCSVSAEQFASDQPLIGGVYGSTFVKHTTGDIWRFSEDPAIRFARPFKFEHGYRLSIQPETPHSVQYPPYNPPQSAGEAPDTFQIHMRMRPNEQYHISLDQLYDYRGQAMPALEFLVTTPAAPVPESPTTHRSADFYCALGHRGWLRAVSTGGTTSIAFAAKVGAMLAKASIRCARLGPIPSILATSADPRMWSWQTVDSAIDGALHFGIVPSPYVLDAQNAPTWGAGGAQSVGEIGPAFATPVLYSKYVTTLVKHIYSNFPRIRKFECGVNEPNAHENFNNSTWNADSSSDQLKASRLAAFLLTCYAAVHAVNQSYEVDAPGVESGVPADDYLSFLDELYSAGCGYGKCWDVLTMHEYPWIDPAASVDTQRLTSLYGKGKGPSLTVSYKLFQARATHNEHALHTGKSQFPVAITETGFSSSSTSSNGLDEKVQAAYTATFLNRLAADRSVRYLVWSDVDDNFEGLFGDNSLYRADSTLKPVWAVWQMFARY